METAIFYFTGTGNSLYGAKRLRESINGEVKLISIPRAIKDGTLNFNYERIGFSFPLYYLGLPEIVESFIKEASFTNVKYSFTLTTAGITPGITGKKVESLLKDKGIKLNLNKWIYFTSNYIRKLKIQSEDKINSKIGKNELELEKFADEINQGVSKRIPAHKLLKFVGSGLYREWKKNLSTSAASFTASNKCKKCGVCSRVCPMDNISVGSKVEWGERCQDCVACIHHCPTKAIEIIGNTEGKRRYINPEITLKEIINANN